MSKEITSNNQTCLTFIPPSFPGAVIAVDTVGYILYSFKDFFQKDVSSWPCLIKEIIPNSL